MNIRKNFFAIHIICALLFFTASMHGKSRTVIALQPLGSVNKEIIDEAVKGIISMYSAEVKVLPSRDLPAESYYKPTSRYRAEILLDFLEKNTDDAITKIIGLTEKDISTTKGKIFDWGIFGLGRIRGRSCVVSSFRLYFGNATKKKFLFRLVKVVNHELGHTFGVNHCATAGCLMEDAKGTIVTLDGEDGSICGKCAVLLRDVILQK